MHKDKSYRAINPHPDYHKLLQGRYEAERLPGDFSPERLVPDFSFNVLNPTGLLYRPVVDEAYLAQGGKKPVWPQNKPFAACLTHDVDRVSVSTFQQSSRIRELAIRNDRTFQQKVRNALGTLGDIRHIIKRVNARDPLHCYEKWLKVEAEVNARSTFFFWPGWSAVRKHHSSDCVYELSDQIWFDGQRCTVKEMIREIDRRGWEIGLHPSWYSFNDVGEMKRQKDALEKALGKDVVSVRQHFLHYDIRVTPRVQSEAGFKYDSTLGFNDNIGFRFGTSYPWQLYDLKTDIQLPLVEVPLIVQDGAMLSPVKGMRLDHDMAFEYVVMVAETVKKVGGVLTLLWHPQYIINPDWWRLYLCTIDYLKQQNAWFCTTREAGAFCSEY